MLKIILNLFLIVHECYPFYSQSTSLYNRKAILDKTNFISDISQELPLSTEITELPDSFLDSVQRSVKTTVNCLSYGSKKCRIDFDTAVGDMT